MPTLNIVTNVPCDGVLSSDLLKDASKAVSRILSKPESVGAGVFCISEGGTTLGHLEWVLDAAKSIHSLPLSCCLSLASISGSSPSFALQLKPVPACLEVCST